MCLGLGTSLSQPHHEHLPGSQSPPVSQQRLSIPAHPINLDIIGLDIIGLDIIDLDIIGLEHVLDSVANRITLSKCREADTYWTVARKVIEFSHQQQVRR